MTTKSELGPQPTRHLIVPVMDYESPSSRIHGFQDLINLGLPPPTPMHVIGDEVYRRYQKNHGELDFDSKMELSAVFDEIKQKNPTRGVYVGRAFYVPGIDNPNGPRTAAIHDKATFITMVKKFYTFVEENNYNLVEGSDIALITHPFINVTDERPFYGDMPISRQDHLPWSGGYISPDPVPGAKNTINVVAVFGADEAVQSYHCDAYTVDPDRQSIVKKEISKKTHTLIPGTGDVYKQIKVPNKFQLEQALTDTELLRIAQDTKNVLDNNKRVEFILQHDGIFYREIAPWEPVSSKDLLKLDKGEVVEGSIVKIVSDKDISRIRGPQIIAYFGPETFRSRTTDLFAQAAYTPDKTNLIALVHGSLKTSHMARVLTDAGHSVILVGDKKYRDGTSVRIGRSPDGSPLVELLNPYENAVASFEDAEELYKGEAGMKVARLSIMRDQGIVIPDGFGLKSDAVWHYLEDIGAMQDIVLLDSIDIHAPEKMDYILERIHKKIKELPLPVALEAEITNALSQCGFTSWAIRSSGNEDGENQSLAGLYSSAVNKTNDEVIPSIQSTIASYFSKGSVVAVRSGGGKPSHMVIGVGVHEFIEDSPGTIGMVVFSKSDSIVIEATHGSPEGIVSGTAKDFCRITLERKNGNGNFVITEEINRENFSLSEETLFQVGTTVVEIEKIFKTYQDVELLVTPERGIVVVQARPL